MIYIIRTMVLISPSIDAINYISPAEQFSIRNLAYKNFDLFSISY